MNPMQFLMQMISGGKNPQQALQAMIQQHPEFNAMLNQQRQSGMSMEQYTRNYAQQHNIDIQQMLNALSQKGFKP